VEELRQYLDFLRVQRNLSPATLDAYERDLTHFLDFVWEQLELLDRPQKLQEVDKYLVREYLAYLAREGYARSSVARRLASIRGSAVSFSPRAMPSGILPCPWARRSSPRRFRRF